MDPNSENHSLDDLEKQLQDAARKLLDGDPSVENELERLDKAIKQHPEHAERVAVAEHKWELDQDASNRRALDTTRRFVPRDIFKSTASTVERRYAVRAAADRVPRRAAAALSKRVWTTSVLWLVHLEEARIKKLHPADLRSRYAVAGLDIVELRAVYAVLPIAFDNDSDGSKAKWREGIRNKLKEMVNKEERNALSKAETRHAAYAGAPDALDVNDGAHDDEMVAPSLDLDAGSPTAQDAPQDDDADRPPKPSRRASAPVDLLAAIQKPRSKSDATGVKEKKKTKKPPKGAPVDLLAALKNREDKRRQSVA